MYKIFTRAFKDGISLSICDQDSGDLSMHFALKIINHCVMHQLYGANE